MISKLSYSDWKDEYKFFLNKLKEKQVFLCYSGGKDSSMVMDFLVQAREDFGFDFVAHSGAFPKDRYTDEEVKRLGNFWENRGVEIIWHKFTETDDFLRNSDNPCHECQRLRKELLKKLVTEVSDLDQLVIIISFTLWDLVSYSVEHILGSLYMNRTEKDSIEQKKRYLETSQRFYPIMSMDEGYTIFRPMIKLNSTTVKDYINRKGIPILSVPCEFKDYRPKRLLDNYYNKIGLFFDYEKVFHFAKKNLNLPATEFYESIDMDKYLSDFF